jgi:hypothetical protein
MASIQASFLLPSGIHHFFVVASPGEQLSFHQHVAPHALGKRKQFSSFSRAVIGQSHRVGELRDASVAVCQGGKMGMRRDWKSLSEAVEGGMVKKRGALQTLGEDMCVTNDTSWQKVGTELTEPSRTGACGSVWRRPSGI